MLSKNSEASQRGKKPTYFPQADMKRAGVGGTTQLSTHGFDKTGLTDSRPTFTQPSASQEQEKWSDDL